MVQPQRRQCLLVALLVAVVLVCGLYIWEQQSQPTGAATSAIPAVSVGEAKLTESEVVVYVSGYVVRPGVYTLSGEPRAIDAVNAAGGFVDGADAARINLAQKLVDGTQVHVPGNLSATPDGAQPGGNKVSLNHADKKQLESLPGIGPALADRILDHRKTQGGFKTIEELRKVSGIGDAKYNALKDKITL